LLALRNAHDESIEMMVMTNAINLVMRWLTSGLYMLGSFFVQPFDPNVIAEFKAITVSHDER
jgi:hypothetical protein